jgi:hypothetical protein
VRVRRGREEREEGRGELKSEGRRWGGGRGVEGPKDGGMEVHSSIITKTYNISLPRIPSIRKNLNSSQQYNNNDND